MLLVASMPASAHDPTPNRNGDGYSSSNRLRRVWSTANKPPPWVEDAVDLAIDHAPSSGADIPTFASSPAPTIRGIIHYVIRSKSNCSELPTTVWACADNNMVDDNEWHITFLPQGAAAGGGNIDWCEAHNPDHESGCVRADRIAIHELGHVLDLDHYPGGASVNSDTVMRSTTPNVDYTGGQATYFRTCDKARLFIKHGPNSPKSSWPDCLDDVTGGVANVGLDTIIGLSITDESPCRYQSVAFSGYLKTNDVAGQYSNTRAKPLEDRTVELQRKAYGSSGGFATVHSSDETSSTGYYYITHEFLNTGAWVYHARFGGEEGLSGDLSGDHVVNVLPC